MARVLPFVPTVFAKAAIPRPQRALLGDVLVKAGALDARRLAQALEQQRAQDQRLGHILVVNGAISAEDLGAALSHQSGLGRIDLAASPVDSALLADLDPYRCLELEAVPWRQIGGARVVAISNPDSATAAEALCGAGAENVAFAIASPDDIRRAISDGFRRRLRDDARDRCPESLSCRGWGQASRRWRLLGAGCVALLGIACAPLLALQALMAWILLANAMTMGLRLVALFARVKSGRRVIAGDAARLADYKKLPCVSILVPLLREEKVAQKLMEGLAALDYPAALLDIKLVLEEHDTVTRAAIERMGLPANMEIISVPADGLRTKPRAMNYALPFCRGEIVGVYDAEDRPEASQIRMVVERLRDAPPDVACVQGYLDFYNSDRNWLARCFTLEYAIWFRVILMGVQRLRLPIPLGGTTVFFRRRVLDQIGGWDAHNVTEDADLGMRLARFGYRCEMIPTTTLEEANFRAMPWIKQRSRWLKGYAITWATHMRDPRQLLRDLGVRGFVGFQVLFLGALTSYLSLPLFWLLWAGTAGFDFAFWETFPDGLRRAFFASMLLGQAVMLTIAFIAARDSGRRGLWPWMFALPFYWPMGAVAAYRAIAEIFYAPFYWHKTEHGIATREDGDRESGHRDPAT
ncbi:glycosyltransferase [uncultured Amaricoccus sp.]|uniref:glycosyltransferase family 2 protein n=1 Tax=uncultured Amaricoccus sp. TaxID=339341 RepID=UPI0026281B93|nr:glycosyltransferase [uncultured Amaricoccus sp.]